MKNMEVIVTGGAGFIGSHLADSLVKKGAAVTILDDLSTGSSDNLSGNSTFIKIKASSPGVSHIFREKRPTIVFHLAANTNVPRSVRDPACEFASLQGALNILKNCRKYDVGQLVFASSGFIYGNKKKRPIPESAGRELISPYAVTKNTVENYIALFGNLYGLKYKILRLATVYGPRQTKGAMSDYITKLASGRQAVIYGNGSKTRDYVYIDDVIDAFHRVLDLSPEFSDPVFNVGSGRETSLLDLYRRIARLLSTQAEPIFRPDRSGELLKYSLDSRKIEQALGWKPKTTLDRGLAATLKSRKLC